VVTFLTSEGEKTIVPDPDKARRQNIEQELTVILMIYG
jgi:hypothetical protein